jgi:hypothetical protein
MTFPHIAHFDENPVPVSHRVASIESWRLNPVAVIGMRVTDVSALGNAYTLDLRYCYRVTDVNELGNVHTLNLSHCDEVTDVSELHSEMCIL